MSALSPSRRRIIRHYIGLKVHLFGGTFRSKKGLPRGVVFLGFVASALAGLIVAVGAVVLQRLGSPEEQRQVLVVAVGLYWLLAGLLAAVTGLDATVDPRKLAGLPLRSADLAIADLLSGFVSVATPFVVLSALGVVVAFAPDRPVTVVVVALIIVIMLLTHRVVALTLGYMASTRLRPIASLVNVVAGLMFILVGQAPQIVLDDRVRPGGRVGRSVAVGLVGVRDRRHRRGPIRPRRSGDIVGAIGALWLAVASLPVGRRDVSRHSPLEGRSVEGSNRAVVGRLEGVGSEAP